MLGSSFTLRKNRICGSDGKTLLFETFYLNNETLADAMNGIFHCFAYGDSLWNANYQSKKVCSNYISFNYYLEGGADIQYGSRRLHVCAHDMLLAQFRNGFSIRTGREGIARKQCLLLSYTPLQSAIIRQLFPEDLAVIHLPEPEKVSAILAQISDAVKKSVAKDALSHLILSFLQELCRQRDFGCYPDTLNDALRFIALPGNENVDREQLAAHCKVSVSTLNRLFIQHLKCSPGQYLLRKKLDFSARMLMLDNINIKQIAYQSGFSSPAFFTRIFKKHYGMTPKEFRLCGAEEQGRAIMAEHQKNNAYII